jgi:GntR family transcriptional regulator/MocR family aminotransferase
VENSQFSSISPDQFQTMASSSRRGVSRALYDEIRARIADGTYAAGTALPSTRALALERGVSRATASLVHEQLAADGLVETRAGAATRVLALPDRPGRVSAGTAAFPGGRSAFAARVERLAIQSASAGGEDEFDFVYGPLSGRDFPTSAWLQALRVVEHRRPVRLAYEDPRGNLELRRALQAHLSRSRGLSCAVEQLMIVNGSQQALDLCARLLVDAGDTVVVEDPGYRMAHHVFEAHGARLKAVGIDDQGLSIADLERIREARMLYVTPTHQFPLGSFLPVGRRRSVLDWAVARRAWVVEDDYDSEYRYAVRPEPALYSLDPHGCVIHIGTFSKTLSPQLRLGYLIVPAPLVDTFAAAKRLMDRHAATGVQRALALLLEDGRYDRHVRRIRRVQHARQRALLDALERHLGSKVRVQGAASGLHLVAWFPEVPSADEPAFVDAALRLGVRVHPISPLFLPGGRAVARTRPAGLVMGYALLEPEAIDEGVRRLAQAVRAVSGGRRRGRG